MHKHTKLSMVTSPVPRFLCWGGGERASYTLFSHAPSSGADPEVEEGGSRDTDVE